uniref:Pyrrolidone-carboxylate peptidase-like n=1 Tax=Nelumbo nucifera TaxID=4432 RepID=A0A822YNP6_NELNU|nr:TPA_asm: hypothetical protein HUJ06_009759 [Nelumbo nucifera]
MGSEGPLPITVHVTGFKKFYGVANNPTEVIVSNLKEFLKRRGMPGGIILGSCTVLEAAGHGVLPTLYQLMESGRSEPFTNSSSDGPVIWLHFGANAGALKFAIERQAVNEATFLCPDELGWQPQKLAIFPEDGGTFQTRKVSCILCFIICYLLVAIDKLVTYSG